VSWYWVVPVLGLFSWSPGVIKNAGSEFCLSSPVGVLDVAVKSTGSVSDSDGVACAFCDPPTLDWPFHYTRHAWLSLIIGALEIVSVLIGIFLGLRYSKVRLRF